MNIEDIITAFIELNAESKRMRAALREILMTVEKEQEQVGVNMTVGDLSREALKGSEE